MRKRVCPSGNVAQVFRHPGRTVAELPDAILDACVLQQVGIFRQVVFDRSDRSSVLPAFDGAADGGVDLIRVADYRLDRIFRTGLQVGRLECFGVPVAVGSLDFEFECRPLRYENGSYRPAVTVGKDRYPFPPKKHRPERFSPKDRRSPCSGCPSRVTSSIVLAELFVISITILVSRWVNTIFTAVWLRTTSVAVAASRSEAS